MYLWQSLLICFGSLSCMSKSPSPTSRAPDGIKWYAVITGLIQFALHLVQILDFAIGKRIPSHTPQRSLHHALRLVCYRGLQLFHQLFFHTDLFYLTERFRTLICQSKGLYATTLLYSLCALWPTEAFWHYFASSTMVSGQQFCNIGQLYRVFWSQWKLTHFLWYWFCSVIFGVISPLSCKLLTLMKLSSALIVAFDLTAVFLVLFLFKWRYNVTFGKRFIHTQY